ncbi:patatin family protein [Xenophilus sp. AP218F]|nr:patatin family protein [Chromobacterium sp. ASV5]OWY39593.1 patatin family protein [Xenophilus sp. AP218F]
MTAKTPFQPKKALVAEGGAMRGIFAAGVLDTFMEQNHQPFDLAIGVSAGSTNLIGYLAGDYRRNYQIITKHARSKRFMNVWRFLRGGHLCDVRWLWQASYRDTPLNVERYLQGPCPLWAVTTNADTGEAGYYRVTEANMHCVLPASCAIPLAYRDFIRINGAPMTDGGLADPIPVKRAYEQGARDITVILSHPLGYHEPQGHWLRALRPFFKEHPSLYDSLLAYPERYNQALAFIQKPPADCALRIIAPPSNFMVNSFTTDLSQLKIGYQLGCYHGLKHLYPHRQGRRESE